MRGNTAENVLELVFTDNHIIVKDIEVTDPLGRSDHGCVNLKCDVEPQEKKCKRYISIWKGRFGEIWVLLAVNWDEYLDSQDIGEIRTLFKKKLQDAIDECIPKKENLKACMD